MKKRTLQLASEGWLLALVLFAFLLGGSARADTSSVILLRPIAFVALAYALTRIIDCWHENKAIVGVALAWIGLTALHLVPLPPAVWQALPGRDLAAAIDAATGMGRWRPISLVPWRTLNALLSLCVPLAALLLALRSPLKQHKLVVFLLLALVWASAILGLLQVIGGVQNPFYTYRITNFGSAVGLFANRNHNAIFLSLGFPLLAAASSLSSTSAENVRVREWAGAGIALLLIPFILTTQSRAGILVSLVCIAAGWWVYRSPLADTQKRRPRKQLDYRLVFGALAAIGVAMLTVLFSATNAIVRLSQLGRGDDELRLQIWPVIIQMIAKYFPVGSGMGTFVEVFQIDEPDALLRPSYVNHAHNDWLEVLLDGGVPAAALVALSVWVVGRKAAQALRRGGDREEEVLRRLGVTICGVVALSSLYDYPLRTPAGAVLLAVGVAFAAGRLRRFDTNERR